MILAMNTQMLRIHDVLDGAGAGLRRLRRCDEARLIARLGQRAA
jgi:hypothetical protein